MGLIMTWILGILARVFYLAIMGEISIGMGCVSWVAEGFAKIWNILLVGLNGSVLEMLIAPPICIVLVVFYIAFLLFVFGSILLAIAWYFGEYIRRASLWKVIVMFFIGVLTAVYYKAIGWALAGIAVLFFLTAGGELEGHGFFADGIFWFFKDKD